MLETKKICVSVASQFGVGDALSDNACGLHVGSVAWKMYDMHLEFS